jgi:hypothetical protein
MPSSRSSSGMQRAGHAARKPGIRAIQGGWDFRTVRQARHPSRNVLASRPDALLHTAAASSAQAVGSAPDSTVAELAGASLVSRAAP